MDEKMEVATCWEGQATEDLEYVDELGGTVRMRKRNWKPWYIQKGQAAKKNENEEAKLGG